jgi:RimJ/RimL family protein N-acetyltransferase
MTLVIKTERLILKPLLVENADSLFKLMHNQVDTTYLSWEPHPTIETTFNLIQSLQEAQKNDKGYHWCVHFDDEIIGVVSLIDVRRTIRTWTINRSELSYWIGKSFTGKGYATEAASAIVNYGFSHLALHKIIIAHALENTESKKICRKLGFQEYGHEHHAFMKEGRWQDLIWYEMLK